MTTLVIHSETIYFAKKRSLMVAKTFLEANHKHEEVKVLSISKEENLSFVSVFDRSVIAELEAIDQRAKENKKMGWTPEGQDTRTLILNLFKKYYPKKEQNTP